MKCHSYSLPRRIAHSMVFIIMQMREEPGEDKRAHFVMLSPDKHGLFRLPVLNASQFRCMLSSFLETHQNSSYAVEQFPSMS